MPWKEKVIVTMREEFVKRVLSHYTARSSRCIVVIDFLSVINLSIINSGLQSNFHFNLLT